MRTVKLNVTETLKYQREIMVRIPDDMSEDDLGEALDFAQQNEEFLSDFVYSLKESGIELAESYDDDLSSPYSAEVECDDYDFVESVEA